MMMSIKGRKTAENLIVWGEKKLCVKDKKGSSFSPTHMEEITGEELKEERVQK